jgi:thiamine biosynthesis protein ThiS
MKILINGETRQFEESKTITGLVAELSLEPKMVLIEHNGTALHRSEWTACLLSEGDRIEILQVAAGG